MSKFAMMSSTRAFLFCSRQEFFLGWLSELTKKNLLVFSLVNQLNLFDFFHKSLLVFASRVLIVSKPVARKNRKYTSCFANEWTKSEITMKKFVGLVVVLAALVLGGYYAMGVATEHTLKKNLSSVNQTNGLVVDIASYDRGWFTSNALLNWKLHVPASVTKTADGQTQTVPAQDFNMQMPVTIYHGPVIFANDGVHFGLGYGKTVLTLPPEYSEKFKQKFTDDSVQPHVDLSLFVNYFNNSQVGMSVPEFKVTAKEGGAHFEWLGMDSKMDVSSSADKVDGDFDIHGIKITKDDTTANVGQIDADYKLHKTEGNYYIGEAGISLPSVVVNNKDQQLFELDGFKANSSSDIESGLFSSHFQSSVDKVIVNGRTYGPGSLEMAVRNLDASVWARINEVISTIQQGTDAEKQQAVLAILPQLPKLFSKGAEFEISEMSLGVPEGTIEGNLMLSLPVGDFSNPFEMMQKIKGNGKLKVPAEILRQGLAASNRSKLTAQPAASTPAQATEPGVQPQAQPATDTTAATTQAVAPADVEQQVASQTTQQLTNLVQSGLLVQQGSDYTIDLSFENGQLSVNGKPFNPTMLKF